MPEKIERFRGDHAFLSNFHPCTIAFEGITFPTVEHAFQAAKTLDETERRAIAVLDTPTKAKRAGRRVELRPGWNEMRVAVMESLVRLKFGAQEPKALLLSTGNAELIETNNWNDRFWGVCRGAGENHLGRILMQVRAEQRIR